MSTVEAVVSDSPVRFEHAVAYALHPAMRRLIILYVVGVLMTPFGVSMFLGPTTLPIVDHLLGLAIAILGAVFLFGGLVGTLFKLVTDATILARTHRPGE